MLTEEMKNEIEERIYSMIAIRMELMEILSVAPGYRAEAFDLSTSLNENYSLLAEMQKNNDHLLYKVSVQSNMDPTWEGPVLHVDSHCGILWPF